MRCRPETDHANALRLVAKFDKTEGKINEEITCHVEAERIGFRGYGMMLAEIGVPPGAEVDHSSLESARKSSGWTIDPVYNALMSAGEKAIPCLIRKIIDTTPMRDPVPPAGMQVSIHNAA